MTRIKDRSSARWKSSAATRLLRASHGATSVDDAIKRVVATLLEGVTCPPTDLEAICPKLGVAGIVGEPIACSGELRRTEDGLQIVYSSSMPATRRRFTIAHEMGHAFFEGTGPRCPRTGSELERLCDMIASEILMPSEVFLRALSAKVTAKNILDLSRHFGASLAATAIRCSMFRELAAFMIDGEAVCWSSGLLRVSRVAGLSYDLREAISAVSLGAPISQPVFVHTHNRTRYWNVDALSLGAAQRWLFVMAPAARR